MLIMLHFNFLFKCKKTLSNIKYNKGIGDKMDLEKKLLLDVECLNNGLPPMSNTTRDVVKMIRSVSSKEKRRINRKIKKICKRRIHQIMTSKKDRSCSEKNRLKQQILDRLAFNRDNGLFNNAFMEKRIDFVRTFFVESIRRKR